MRSRRLLAIGLLAWVLPLGGLSAAGPGSGDELVVELMDGIDAATRDAALAARGLRVVEAVPGSRFVLARPVSGLVPSLDPSGPVVGVRRPVAHRAMGAPNDPVYRFQWHLTAVQAEEAWDIATGSGATVAVLDTGVAPNAPDLAGTRFTSGHDWVDDDATAQDENGHGTHVVGTIAQTTGNGLGLAGLAHGATIMPLRVLDADGAGIDYDIALALHHAADAGAAVVNMSLGADQSSPVLQEAVAYAASKGVVLVAAAGNEDATVAYPAAYPEVIAVGAVRYDGTRSHYSNKGTGLGLVAPGGDVSVDQNRDGYGDGVLQQTFTGEPPQWCYCFYQGTSMSSPHVAATAALIASTGTRDRGVIRTALESTAVDLGAPGRDDEYGWGLLQAADALRAALAAPAPSAPPSAPVPAPGPGPGPAPPPEPEPPSDPGPEPDPTQPRPVPVPTPEPVQVTVTPHDIDDACPEASVPRGRFADVDPASTHARAIDCVAWLGIAQGTHAKAYSPGGSVTRAQMASFVARTVERAGFRFPQNPPDAFVDDEGSAHEQAINRLAAVGVVKGTTARLYAPKDALSRAALATFLTRAHDLVADRALPATGDFFDDDTGNFHEEQIDRAAAPGIATGVAPRTYRPTATLSRAQMATFIARTLDLLIDEGQAPRPGPPRSTPQVPSPVLG